MRMKNFLVRDSTVSAFRGDCLAVMRTLSPQSVDLVLCDPPYGTSDADWDSPIPAEEMWACLWHCLKPEGAVLLFSGQPFTSDLIISQKKYYRYNWYWNKRKAANFLFQNDMPGKIIEDICVFYKKQPTYNPQKSDNPKGIEKRSMYRRSQSTERAKDLMSNMPKFNAIPGQHYEADKLLPNNLLEFSKPSSPVHPTQKPVELLKYLIRTYTNKGDTVLDFTMGSGSTGVACVMTGRHFVGVEKSKRYYKTALRRIENQEGDREASEPKEFSHMKPLFGKKMS